MAILASTIKGSADGSNVTTDPIDTTGAACIAIAVGLGNFAAMGTLSDSEGNTWTGHGGYSGGNNSIEWYVCEAPTTSATHTFSHATSSKRPTLAVVALDNVNDMRVDTGAQSNGATSNTSPNVTPIAADEVMLSALMFDNADTVSVGSPMTILEQTPWVSGQCVGVGIAWGETPNTTPLGVTWTWTNSCVNSQHLMIMDTFVPVAPTIEGSHILGIDGSVETTRTGLINLDGVTRTVSGPGIEFIGGSLGMIEQASAPSAKANTALIYAEDNGSGKTRLMVKFPTGSAIQLSIEV
jgi:hypothetical protein